MGISCVVETLSFVVSSRESARGSVDVAGIDKVLRICLSHVSARGALFAISWSSNALSVYLLTEQLFESFGSVDIIRQW